MRWVWLGVLAGGLAALSWNYLAGQTGNLSASESRAVRAGLSELIGAGGAELLEPVTAKDDPDGKLVCGWVRGTGNDARSATPAAFVGLLRRDGTFGVAKLARTPGETDAVREACRYRGLLL
jgi:hypothetical protein